MSSKNLASVYILYIIFLISTIYWPISSQYNMRKTKHEGNRHVHQSANTRNDENFQ